MNLFHWTWHWPAWAFPCVFPFHLPSPPRQLYLHNDLILVPPTGWVLCIFWHLPVLCLLFTTLLSPPILSLLPNSPTHPSNLSVNATYYLLPLAFFFLTVSPQSKLSCLSFPIFFFFTVFSYCIIIELIVVHRHVHMVITRHSWLYLPISLS